MKIGSSSQSRRIQRLVIVLLVALCSGLIIFQVLYCDCPPNSIPAYEFDQYVLYTWNERSDGLCFALMIQADRYRFLRRWFPKRKARCGVTELRQALAALPKNSFVLWQDSRSKGFDYPDEQAVRELIDFAKDLGIRLEVSREVE